MRSSVMRGLLVAAALLAAPSTRLDAQVTTATLYGILRDPTGAVLPGATVTVTHEGTGVERTSLTDDHGEFAVAALPAGAYTLRLELQGFKTRTIRGVQLSPGQTFRQTFEIEVGAVEESVIVHGVAPLIETAASKQVLAHSTQEVIELPLQRRNITGILGLGPGSETASGNAIERVAGGGTGIGVRLTF